MLNNFKKASRLTSLQGGGSPRAQQIRDRYRLLGVFGSQLFPLPATALHVVGRQRQGDAAQRRGEQNLLQTWREPQLREDGLKEGTMGRKERVEWRGHERETGGAGE